jgi:hypothetical protein
MQIQVFIKSAVWETAAAADQRNLTARASITDFAPKVKNNRGESVTKLVQAHDVWVRRVHAALMRTCTSQRRWVTQLALLGDEERVIQACKTAKVITAAVLW